MNSVVWWSTLSLVVIATAADVRSRRIPNWLTLPFLVGGIGYAIATNGVAGLERSLGGIALATATLGVVCAMRGMGMGDLKLCAAVGAWIGYSQLGVALIIMAISGALIAILQSAVRGEVKESFDGVGELVAGFGTRGLRPHPTLSLSHPHRRAIPYAPAILIGTVFSFFCS